METPKLTTPPAVSFAGPSGVGKTSMLTSVVKRLDARGLRVSVVKHHGHPLEADKPGTDTWNLRRAGASEALLIAQNQALWMSDANPPPSLESLINLFLASADVVLVEGFRSAGLPTIVLYRAEADDPSWQPPPERTVVARLHPDQVDEATEIVVGLLRTGRGQP